MAFLLLKLNWRLTVHGCYDPFSYHPSVKRVPGETMTALPVRGEASLGATGREGGREGWIMQVPTKERLSEAKPLWRPEGRREGGREGGRMPPRKPLEWRRPT